ncbi:GNAT family N-acetyltransferase [Streptomyces sp. NPDC052396]|uniref:GNAT family N-acetyltransferase n=1 Tax=Streptomyces sp. NPDC052396 TaxID=3365689 RepID=UPI0037CFD354
MTHGGQHGDLLLRPWREGDVQAVQRGIADPDFRRWNAVTIPPPTADGAHDYLRRSITGWQEGRVAAFAVVMAGPDCEVVIGDVRLANFSWINRSARISYWVLPEYRGRGRASGAVEAVTRWGFGPEVGLHRIELSHVLPNRASCRVAGRCGYLPEGVMRGEMPGTDGRMWDAHLHARLATDPVPGHQGQSSPVVQEPSGERR